jgi:hypothetical protein
MSFQCMNCQTPIGGITSHDVKCGECGYINTQYRYQTPIAPMSAEHKALVGNWLEEIIRNSNNAGKEAK